jgi:hypothetical protein
VAVACLGHLRCVPKSQPANNREINHQIRQLTIDFAAEERLPAMYPLVELAEAGGFMSYGASRLIYFAVLRATRQKFEQPTKFELGPRRAVDAARPRRRGDRITVHWRTSFAASAHDRLWHFSAIGKCPT